MDRRLATFQRTLIKNRKLFNLNAFYSIDVIAIKRSGWHHNHFRSVAYSRSSSMGLLMKSFMPA